MSDEQLELMNKIDESIVIDRFISSEEYKLFEKAANEVVNRAVDKFALSTKADNIVEIIELQTIIRKYKYGLFGEMKRIIEEGKLAFLEAKEKGIINDYGFR